MHYDTEYRDSQSQTSPYHRVKGVIIARFRFFPRHLRTSQPESQDKIVVRIGDMQMFWRLVIIIVIGDQALQDDGLHGQLPKKAIRDNSYVTHLSDHVGGRTDPFLSMFPTSSKYIQCRNPLNRGCSAVTLKYTHRNPNDNPMEKQIHTQGDNVGERLANEKKLRDKGLPQFRVVCDGERWSLWGRKRSSRYLYCTSMVPAAHRIFRTSLLNSYSKSSKTALAGG
ncbi:hypothetical protein BGY98DRAFT_940937 [Russula aff. rugulosa BPL654]|nr:hypothetical protein BGY98DRAFT_940937 [Russula aff. rugulosa BPL654]